jgi:hypothetical protein
MSDGSNRLPVLAAEIKLAHADSRRAAQMSVESAIKAGLALIEAKALVKHGGWLPWLRDNCEMSPRSASDYMRLARHKDQIGNAADLTISAAVDALVVERPSAQASYGRLLEHMVCAKYFYRRACGELEWLLDRGEAIPELNPDFVELLENSTPRLAKRLRGAS